MNQSQSSPSSRQISLTFILLLLFAVLPLFTVFYNGSGLQLSEESIGYEPSEVQVNSEIKDNLCEKSRQGATSGYRFRGLVINSFDSSKLMFQNFTQPAEYSMGDKIKREKNRLQCEKWSVVTTIFEPSEAMATQAALPEWCIVVVGDMKTPVSFLADLIDMVRNKTLPHRRRLLRKPRRKDKSPALVDTKSVVQPLNATRNITDAAPNVDIVVSSDDSKDELLKRIVYLSPDDQIELAKTLPFISVIPWNSFARKNIGYLFAIAHGAKYVWDFDDDNHLDNAKLFLKLVDSSVKEVEVAVPILDIVADTETDTDSKNETLSKKLSSDDEKTRRKLSAEDIARHADHSTYAFNPYPLMGAPTLPSWPRGLPIEDIKLSQQLDHRLYRSMNLSMTNIGVVQSLADNDPDVDAIYRLTQPLPFSFPRDGSFSFCMVPENKLSPYNAQATLHYSNMLWSLLLPITVHGRVADIWRSYIAMRLARELGLKLIFSRPLVSQYRNSHDYIADFDSEDDLYKRSSTLINQLFEWKPSTKSLPGMIEELWVYLYERGYIMLQDVSLVQVWINALTSVGYRFPDLILRKS